MHANAYAYIISFKSVFGKMKCYKQYVTCLVEMSLNVLHFLSAILCILIGNLSMFFQVISNSNFCYLT